MTDPGREPQADIGETSPIVPDMGGLIGVMEAMAELRQAEGNLVAAQALHRERSRTGQEAAECSVAPIVDRVPWLPRLVGYNTHGQAAADFLIDDRDMAASQAAPFEATHYSIRHEPTRGKEETTITFSRQADATDVENIVPQGDRARGLSLTWWRELRVPEHLWGNLALEPSKAEGASMPSWLGKKVVPKAAPEISS